MILPIVQPGICPGVHSKTFPRVPPLITSAYLPEISPRVPSVISAGAPSSISPTVQPITPSGVQPMIFTKISTGDSSKKIHLKFIQEVHWGVLHCFFFFRISVLKFPRSFTWNSCRTSTSNSSLVIHGYCKNRSKATKVSIKRLPCRSVPLLGGQ